MPSKKLRGRPTAPGAGIARTTAPFSIAPANTLKSDPRNTSVTSAMRTGLRRSGLSFP
jgi:hypothetical protein